MLHYDVADRVLGCLVKIHTALGPGLAESSYQKATALEFLASGLAFVKEPILDVRYRNVVIGQHRPDFIVERKVVLELKCVSTFDEVHTSQVLTYLRITGLKIGLLVNFNVPTLKTGIKRIAL
jgi:GxxExxY protein